MYCLFVHATTWQATESEIDNGTEVLKRDVNQIMWGTTTGMASFSFILYLHSTDSNSTYFKKCRKNKKKNVEHKKKSHHSTINNDGT